MSKTELQTLVVRVKKYLSIIFFLCLVGVFIYAYLHKPEFPSEIVLKQGFIPGQSIYIVQDARDPDEPKSLRFYVNNGGSRNNETMKVRLGKTPPFLVSDTDLTWSSSESPTACTSSSKAQSRLTRATFTWKTAILTPPTV
jgi:hypothetical protein